MINSKHKNSGNFVKQVGGIVLIILGLFLPACTDNQTVNKANNAENDLTVDEIIENTSEHLGETVTVDGEIGDSVGISGFILNEEGQLLVIDPASATATPVEENKTVQVTGEVRQFVLADLERDYNLGWDLDTQKELQAEFEGKPVIVAQSVEQVESE